MIPSSFARVALAAVLAIVVGVANTSAGSAGANVTTTDVTWTILAANCNQLPAGAVLNGKGSLTSITIDRTRNGVRTIRNASHAHGTATDGQGRAYAWSYVNNYRISNTDANQHKYVGSMTDHFSVAGNGGFVNGFTADYSEEYDGGGNLVGFSIIAQRVQGDPITFGDQNAFAPRCDPI